MTTLPSSAEEFYDIINAISAAPAKDLTVSNMVDVLISYYYPFMKGKLGKNKKDLSRLILVQLVARCGLGNSTQQLFAMPEDTLLKLYNLKYSDRVSTFEKAAELYDLIGIGSTVPKKRALPKSPKRVSAKRVSAKRVSAKRVSAKRVSAKRASAKSKTVSAKSKRVSAKSPKRASAKSKRVSAKRDSAKSKRVSAKRVSAKRVSAKRVSAKRASAKSKTVSRKRVSAKKSTPKKSTPKKSTPKKSTPKKSTPKKSTPKKSTPKKSTPKKTGIQIYIYTDKSFIVIGDTKPHKDELKEMGGKYNPNLTVRGVKTAGWVFSQKKLDIVMAHFGKKKVTGDLTR